MYYVVHVLRITTYSLLGWSFVFGTISLYSQSEPQKDNANKTGQDQYSQAPPAGSFGNSYSDDYAINPKERPIPPRPVFSTKPQEQDKASAKEKQKKEKNFNQLFRLGFGIDIYFGLAKMLTINTIHNADSIPTPYVHNPQVIDVRNKNNTEPIQNNYYEISLLLHFSSFFELKFGIGYQSESFLTKLNTPGQSKVYDGRRVDSNYAVKYQKEAIFYEIGAAILLPWVLSEKSSSVLGLRFMGTIGLGFTSNEVMGLAKPTFPDSLSPLFPEPIPSYNIIEYFPQKPNPPKVKMTATLGAYFEIIGFRFHAGYTLQFFPEELYTDRSYQVLEEFSTGIQFRYSSLMFPKESIIHTLNIGIQYWITPKKIINNKGGLYRTIRSRFT